MFGQQIILDGLAIITTQEASVTAETAEEIRRPTPDQSGSALDVLAKLEGQIFASVPEVAVVLRSDPRSVRRSIAAGDIPCTKVGPRSLIPVQWLREAAGLETSEAGR